MSNNKEDALNRKEDRKIIAPKFNRDFGEATEINEADFPMPAVPTTKYFQWHTSAPDLKEALKKVWSDPYLLLP